MKVFGKEVLYTSFLSYSFSDLLMCNKNIKQDSLLLEETGAGDFGSIYMILVFVIAALLLVVVVKPIFSSTQKTIAKTTGQNQ